MQAVSGTNKQQLATALRGVQMLQGPDGPDPKLLSLSKLHLLGEVCAAPLRGSEL